MDRRAFLGTLALLGAPRAGEAQPAGRVHRIGFLGDSTAALEANLVGPFREGLRDLGYVEGRNVLIEYRWAEGKYDHFPALFGKLLALKAAVCLASVVAVLVLLAAPSTPEAQPTKISRIGILSGGSGVPPPLLDAFRQTLRDLGHHEGRNILIEYRSAEAKPEWLPGLAEELVRLQVDVIVAINTPASQAAKAATGTIPIVFTWVVDPLSLVTSLARPGAKRHRGDDHDG